MILGVIQVRMGSTRLANKALLEIGNRPILWYICERVKASQLIDQIAIATADTEENAPIVKFARENGIGCYAGSEDDLIDRFYQTAETFRADVLVRITGDCPFADPAVIDRIIKFYLDNTDKYDYVTNVIKPTYPDGLDTDVIPFKTIKNMNENVKDSFWREWLTRCIIEHPQSFRSANVENEKNLSHLRWTIDYEEDFIFVKEVFLRLYSKKKIFLMEDILKLLKKEPQLSKMNERYARDHAYYKAKEEAKK